ATATSPRRSSWWGGRNSFLPHDSGGGGPREARWKGRRPRRFTFSERVFGESRARWRTETPRPSIMFGAGDRHVGVAGAGPGGMADAGERQMRAGEQQPV